MFRRAPVPPARYRVHRPLQDRSRCSNSTLANVGLDLAYLDQPEFIKFWDEDAARIETAVRQIGRAQN
jgi:hypothetical protein